MFLLEAPKIQTLELFSAMPAQFRRPRRTAWADANQGGREIDAFLEGPVFDRDGNLFVTDIAYGRVFRVDSQGRWDLVVQWEGEPNGMKFINEHELLITDYLNGLMLLDLTTAKIRPFLERRNSESFRGLNDLFIDTQRNVFFTDQGQTGLHDPTGRVYRLSPSGKLDLLLSNCPSPNGVVLSNDEKFLYVAMTRGNCVWRMPLQTDGSVSKVGQFFISYGPSGPDGLAMSQHGALMVANPGLGYVWALNGRAEPQTVFTGPRGHSLTNLAFEPSSVSSFQQSSPGPSVAQRFVVTDSSSSSLLCAALSP
jgi:gluconolactonase